MQFETSAKSLFCHPERSEGSIIYLEILDSSGVSRHPNDNCGNISRGLNLVFAIETKSLPGDLNLSQKLKKAA